jgi:hypothetical protein
MNKQDRHQLLRRCETELVASGLDIALAIEVITYLPLFVRRSVSDVLRNSNNRRMLAQQDLERMLHDTQQELALAKIRLGQKSL